MPKKLSVGSTDSSRSSLSSLTERQESIRTRAVRVLGRVRRGVSLSEAARTEHIKPATVRKYLRRQFRQEASGKRWKPTKYDRLTVALNVPTLQGLKTVPVRGSRERRILGRYDVALRKWREGQPGAEAELAKLKGQIVGGQLLITDVKVLSTLEDAGLLGGGEEMYAALVRGL